MLFILLLPAGNTPKAADIARAQLVKNSDALLGQIEDLETMAKSFVYGNSSAKELRKLITQTRINYKKSEFLLEYFYPKYIKGKINGAPLYHLDPYAPRAVVHAPNGLQRLDELIHTDDLFDNHEELLKLTRSLKLDFKNLHKNIVNHPLLDREIFEAARLEIIRVFTLGVTGFDTPGSLNGLQEAAASLKQIQLVIQPFYEQLNSGQNTTKSILEESFERGIAQLEGKNGFEDFDRLLFLTQSINPIYGGLLKLQLAINLETPDEVSSLKKSINYSAENIFSEAFLNPYFYSKLTEGSDNDLLRKLGSKLFYDTRISKGSKFSCASCHNPHMAFTDGVDSHLAFDGKTKLKRNSPTLLNSMYSKRFFADMRAFRFDDQIEHVIVSHKEFNTNYESIFDFLKEDKEYEDLFKKTFKAQAGASVSKTNFSMALASYLISLKSFNSPFDRYVRGEIDSIDPKVRRGFNLFMGKAACGTCHFAPTFSGLVPPIYNESESEVLGVLESPKTEEVTLDNDRGRILNGLPKEQVWIYDHSFKTSTVRNIELTGPYFHNGAYENLEEVLDFYNNGGGAGAGLKIENQTLPADSLFLSEAEKADIIWFMKSLTDTSAAKLNVY